MKSLVGFAETVARRAHADQFYGSDQRRRYVGHLLHVQNVLWRARVTDEQVRAAAWLHDVVEDTSTSAPILATLVPVKDKMHDAWIAVCYSVMLLSRTKGSNHVDYFADIAGDRVATVVKLADRIANIEQCLMDLPGVSPMLKRYQREHQDLMACFSMMCEDESERHLLRYLGRLMMEAPVS